MKLSSDKINDTMKIDYHPFTQVTEPLPKRKILPGINNINHLLGFESPATGKIIFSELLIRIFSWDQIVPEDNRMEWNAWVKTLH